MATVGTVGYDRFLVAASIDLRSEPYVFLYQLLISSLTLLKVIEFLCCAYFSFSSIENVLHENWRAWTVHQTYDSE